MCLSGIFGWCNRSGDENEKTKLFTSDPKKQKISDPKIVEKKTDLIQTFTRQLLYPSKAPLCGFSVTLQTDEMIPQILGKTVTNIKGEFTFTSKEGFDPKQKMKAVVDRIVKSEDIVFKIFTHKPIATHTIDLSDSSPLETRYLEPDKYGFPENADQIPNRQDKVRFYEEIVESGIAAAATSILKQFDPCATTEDLQKAFDAKYKRPDLKHDEPTVNEMIHKWLRPIYKIEGERSYVEINWDGRRNKFPKNGPGIPNVKAYYKTLEDGKKVIDEIVVQYPNQKATHYKNGEDSFVEGLQIYACCGLLAAEVLHLGFSHLDTGSDARRLLRHCDEDHPIFQLLWPLYTDVLEINADGKKNLVDGMFAPFQETDISENIFEALNDTCSVRDFHSGPSESVFPNDVCAEREKIFYNAIHKGVTDWVDNNWKTLSSPEKWSSVYWWSEDQVESSFPLIPTDLKNVVNPSVIEANFEGVEKLPRRKKDGKFLTNRPITESREKPAAGDKERLIQALVYPFYRNYLHYWLHILQGDYAINLYFATMTPDFSKLKEGFINITDKDDGGKQVATGRALVDYVRDHLRMMIYYRIKEIRDALTDKKVMEAFKKTGWDLEKIFDRVDI